MEKGACRMGTGSGTHSKTKRFCQLQNLHAWKQRGDSSFHFEILFCSVAGNSAGHRIVARKNCHYGEQSSRTARNGSESTHEPRAHLALHDFGTGLETGFGRGSCAYYPSATESGGYTNRCDGSGIILSCA